MPAGDGWSGYGRWRRSAATRLEPGGDVRPLGLGDVGVAADVEGVVELGVDGGVGEAGQLKPRHPFATIGADPRSR